jgi:peptidoglycan lytic transglycosylase G
MGAGGILSAPLGRTVVDAGEPYPPIGRPMDGVGSSLMEQKRITPRSPRAALEPEHVPVPTRRSKRVRNPLVIVGNAIFTLLILVALAGGVAFAVGKHRFEAPGPLEQDKMVNIPAKLGILDIADLLRKEGVMDEHSAVFLGGVIALKARSELRSGEYLFQKHASVRDVIETMVEGKVVQHGVTIPEGLTSEQIVRRLLETDSLTGNIKEVPHEGTLLPESYRFSRGTPREQVIQRMQRDQRRVVQESWERRVPDLPVRTPEQLIILASIIEKETSRPEERSRVAAVFVNRLKQRKRLESDPTIIYGLVGGKGALGHPITKSEKETPTPYNTYMIDGLPPGPIANPGRASIEAAANPARTKEMFFVADGTGGHVFAETYEQHLRNVARLRGIEATERNAAVASPPDADAGASGRQPTVPLRQQQQPQAKRPAGAVPKKQ